VKVSASEVREIVKEASVEVFAFSVGESVKVPVTSVMEKVEVSSIATTVEQFLDMKELKLAT